MLEIKEIQDLADKKEYTKVFNYFHDEYTQMMHDFLVRHDVEVRDDDCLINYIIKTRIFMPKYSYYTIPIANAMYNEDVSEQKKYALLMDTYAFVKQVFSR